jgi:hypothetical protein
MGESVFRAYLFDLLLLLLFAELVSGLSQLGNDVGRLLTLTTRTSSFSRNAATKFALALNPGMLISDMAGGRGIKHGREQVCREV